MARFLFATENSNQNPFSAPLFAMAADPVVDKHIASDKKTYFQCQLCFLAKFFILLSHYQNVATIFAKCVVKKPLKPQDVGRLVIPEKGNKRFCVLTYNHFFSNFFLFQLSDLSDLGALSAEQLKLRQASIARLPKARHHLAARRSSAWRRFRSLCRTYRCCVFLCLLFSCFRLLFFPAASSLRFEVSDCFRFP